MGIVRKRALNLRAPAVALAGTVEEADSGPTGMRRSSGAGGDSSNGNTSGSAGKYSTAGGAAPGYFKPASPHPPKMLGHTISGAPGMMSNSFLTRCSAAHSRGRLQSFSGVTISGMMKTTSSLSRTLSFLARNNGPTVWRSFRYGTPRRSRVSLRCRKPPITSVCPSATRTVVLASLLSIIGAGFWPCVKPVNRLNVGVTSN